MAKTNELKISPEGQMANEAGKKKREFEADERQKNAKKQKDSRANMKAKGDRQVMTQEKPPGPGMVKPWEGTAPVIHKGTLGVCRRNKYAHAAVREMQRAFLEEIEKEKKNYTGWMAYLSRY